MAFFDNPSVEELALKHIEEVRNLEDKEAKKIIKAYKAIRQDLNDRLQTLPRGTFTAQRIRGVLVQIDAALVEMTKVLSQEMKSSSMTMGLYSSDNLIKEIEKWDDEFLGAIQPVNFDAFRAANDTSNFLFERHQSSLESYSKSLRSHFAIELTEAALIGKSTSEVVHDLGAKFRGEQWRLETIARTELHNVYNIAKLDNMRELKQDSIPDLMKSLFHPMDLRTGEDSKKLNRENPRIPIDEPFRFTYKGQERVFMAPPDRPNDRAILIPYKKSWK